MRSAETSGASATGFGAGKAKADVRKGQSGLSTARTLFGFTLSPVTLAVAITSAVAAGLFVAHDTVRSADEARRSIGAISSYYSDQFAELRPAATTVSFIGPVAAPQAASASWNGILQRGGIAFALAGLATLVVSRRRRDDQPDQVQRQSYGNLAAAIPMGVACWTNTGRMIVCNDQFKSLLNLPHGAANYAEAVKRLTLGGYMKLLNEDDGSRVVELHREDGSCLLIDDRPLADGGFMSLVSDITQAKKTDTLLHAIRQEQRHLARRYHEEKLRAEAASRSKTNFLAHLSHDIRTPLNHIIGFADLMKHQAYGPLGDTRYAEYVQTIKSSGENLLASFASILDLAELEGGQKALRCDPVLVDDLIDDVVKRFSAQASRAGIMLMIGAHSDAVVDGDRLGLSRMVSNIVDNALRFTRSGGRVHLGAHVAHDGIVIEITDTGLGMSEQRLASLSQPFALGDATFTREGSGTGLGISIARAIAEQSGGSLVIDSTPAVGTTVAISLPLSGMMDRKAA